MTWRQRFLTWCGWSYRCYCGAVVPSQYRQQHEDLHAAIRDWLSPPTNDELSEARKLSRGGT